MEISQSFRADARNLMRSYYIYFMANNNNNVLYLGMTNNLERRIYEHQSGLIAGFSQKYKTYKLVYFEDTTDVNAAISREKEIKKWRREKKNHLIETLNPKWDDLNKGCRDFSPLQVARGSK